MKLISKIKLAGLLVLSVLLTVSCATASSDNEIAKQVNNSSVSASAIEIPMVDNSKETLTEELKLKEEVESETENDSKYTYSFNEHGIEIVAEIHDGYGYVSYPTFITDSEIATALKAFTAVHGNFGVEYEKTEPGELKISFPKGRNKADFDYVALIVNNELTWYLNEMFKTPEVETSEIEEHPITEKVTVVTVEKEQATVKEPVETEPAKAQTSASAETVKTDISIALIIVIIVVIVAALAIVLLKKKNH